jgi:hypothetical protein
MGSLLANIKIGARLLLAILPLAIGLIWVSASSLLDSKVVINRTEAYHPSIF